MSEADKITFEYAEECHICDKKHSEKDIRALDHCFRGSAHQECNLKFRLTDRIPIIFHNLQGYDSHLIMQRIGEIAKKHTYKEKEEKRNNIKLVSYRIIWKSTWHSCWENIWVS